VQLTPRSTHTGHLEKKIKKGTIFFGHPVYDMIYLLTAIGLATGGSNTVHIYTQTIHRTTQSTQTTHRTTQLTNWEECRPCPVVASYTRHLRYNSGKSMEKSSVRVAEECQLAQTATVLLEDSRLRNLCLKILFASHSGTQYVCSTVQYTKQSVNALCEQDPAVC
jgi:hypothetical protein